MRLLAAVVGVPASTVLYCACGGVGVQETELAAARRWVPLWAVPRATAVIVTADVVMVATELSTPQALGTPARARGRSAHGLERRKGVGRIRGGSPCLFRKKEKKHERRGGGNVNTTRDGSTVWRMTTRRPGIVLCRVGENARSVWPV